MILVLKFSVHFHGRCGELSGGVDTGACLGACTLTRYSSKELFFLEDTMILGLGISNSFWNKERVIVENPF